MNSISRSAFEALDPVARLSHVRSGGTVASDPPIAKPEGEMPFFIRGEDRRDWLEAQRKTADWLAETATMRAAAG